MLAASVSFGIQIVLLKIGANWIVSALVSIVALYAAFRHWNGCAPANRALQGALMLLLMVRFAVSVAAIGSEAVYKSVMARGDSTELWEMQKTSPAFMGDLSSEASGEPAPSKKRALASIVGARDAIRHAASGWTGNIVHLISSFLLQTLLLPLAFLLIAWRSTRLALDWLTRSSPQKAELLS